MANFTPVNPGDLITANYFNQVLSSFDSRISALEAANINCVCVDSLGSFFLMAGFIVNTGIEVSEANFSRTESNGCAPFPAGN